ncbi:hypothetical protein HAX54_020131 [Datura stramonium]|uniref:Protein DA1-like domain-containing protein n=1 Tax=Datura stramonium TaxID=4076 RepID=A0ABS8USW0_DATST|nr:hypothetical protein [Datura stramonium]
MSSSSVNQFSQPCIYDFQGGQVIEGSPRKTSNRVSRDENMVGAPVRTLDDRFKASKEKRGTKRVQLRSFDRRFEKTRIDDEDLGRSAMTLVHRHILLHILLLMLLHMPLGNIIPEVIVRIPLILALTSVENAKSVSIPCTVVHIPTNAAGLIRYRCHPFWSQKYCPSHEHDVTKRCCSCERLEAILTGKYFRVSIICPKPEAYAYQKSRQSPVYSKGREWVSREVSGNQNTPQKLTRKCEVTAILVLFGFRNLSLEVEEGICQVLSYMWLESEVMPGSRDMPSTSTAASSLMSSSKKVLSLGKNKLGEFFMHQIAHDTSPAYSGGIQSC